MRQRVRRHARNDSASVTTLVEGERSLRQTAWTSRGDIDADLVDTRCQAFDVLVGLVANDSTYICAPAVGLESGRRTGAGASVAIAKDTVSERLELRPIALGTARRIAAGGTPDPSWAHDYPAAGDRDAAQMFLSGYYAGIESTPFVTYQVVRRADQIVIGGAGFHGPPDGEGAVTIGYGVVPSARGAGYASEALLTLIALARRSGVRLIKGDTSPANVASRRVMEKAGFRTVAEDGNLIKYELLLE